MDRNGALPNYVESIQNVHACLTPRSLPYALLQLFKRHPHIARGREPKGRNIPRGVNSK